MVVEVEAVVSRVNVDEGVVEEVTIGDVVGVEAGRFVQLKCNVLNHLVKVHEKIVKTI